MSWMAPDEVTSSRHFVRKLAKKLSDGIQGGLPYESAEYPSDELESVVAAAHASGVYPIVLIERFHAFAKVADDHLLSVLSALRTLEHSGQVTTLALSPVPYDDIRRQLAREGAFPFVNSAYGDNHDRAVISPISRAEFVAGAVAVGIGQGVANKVFSLAGGPDVVFSSLISAASASGGRLIDQSVGLIGDRLDGFFKDCFGELGGDGYDLWSKLALGRLLSYEEDFIETHLLSSFLAKRSRSGAMVCSSPILSRTFFRRIRGAFAIYDEVLNAVRAENYESAVDLAASIETDREHLRSFKCLLQVLAALKVEGGRNLLHIAWDRIVAPAQELASSPNVSGSIREFGNRMLSWAKLVGEHGVSSNDNRLRLDSLTARASDQSVYEVTLFSMLRYLDQQRGTKDPSARLRAIASLPESILQLLCVGHCRIDFSHAPSSFPDVQFDRFFGGREEFRLPPAGKKMDLTDLLVIVPAILASYRPTDRAVSDVCRPERIVPLHQTMVSRIRNPTAHTYADMTEKDVAMITDTCTSWLDLAADLAGHESGQEFLRSISIPDADEVEAFLFDAEAF
ncbi:hypothetical protein [Bradyrhizobium japonicum]|uniref:hypothetical protein n=1 Tax=Bradyrhizobium japonicum TaxID=375 RepID=UPI002714D433|nr:hypothetical protein [Bradyrhizobium japonicum]WLB53902.1 hypothetical protein QIH94_42985 [Bradyrhizobium japonicum]WLB64225.1 hypothetical protein QIH96_02805 [Bradyrhizobium japonicum]